MEARANWLALQADLGRCEGQERLITLESRIAATPFSSYGTDDELLYFGLSCCLTLLFRHTNQSSILIGSRSNAGGARAVSYDFENSTSFSDVLAALEVQRADGPAGSEWLPDVPVVFSFASEGGLGGIPNANAAGCVSLTMSVKGEAIDFSLVFDGSSFREERMREFLDQYLLLAEQAAADPKSNVLDYSLITEKGRSVLPDPAQAIEVPRYPLMPESFAAIAAKMPGAEAVRQSGRSWTYAELDRSSRELARHLRELGVAGSDVVSVTGPRSYGVVSSILGVFRSGAILQTVDPKLPAERQLALLGQSGAKLLVMIGENAALEGCAAQVIRVEPVSGAVFGVPDRGRQAVELPTLEPGAAAYIFFTSGSTGKPKGVVGTHQGLAHFLDWQRKTFEIGPGDCAAQITALSFDMVLRDMFLALTSGATLSIPAESDVLDPSAILTWMAVERISILHVVPTLLRAWLNHVPPGLKLPSLRRVFLAGEPLTDTLIMNFRKVFGDTALITNFYGPTETTLIKCFHPVVTPEPGVQPVGRPQPQTQALILNGRGKLCGIQEIGQIAIRTPFRTLGYLNAPEATAAVFVQSPFRDDPADLLYMTGDSGYYRADGLLIMRGRIDNQVKIRGVRVEPGEIEATISHCRGVNGAAVIPHINANGDKYLAAYVVFADKAYVTQAIAINTVRDFLRSRLPENMVPAAFVAMAELPLLPNGKVDRKSLKAPDLSGEDEEAAVLSGDDAPRNKQEEELLSIWRSVLGHNRVGVNDSFIELGGDSLTAISALVRMQRLGIPNSYAKGIFQGWSIRQIVELADGKDQSAARNALSPKSRANLLVNVMRGILVAVVVTGHWFEGLLNRLPASLHGLQDVFLPLFAAATPGYAIIYGLNLGFIFYPKYLSEPKQATNSLRLGMWLILGGIAINAASVLGLLAINGELRTSTDFFNSFYSALLYYAIANLTVPLWFKLVSKRARTYRTIFLMILGSYACYRTALFLLIDREQQGLLQLVRLMLVAKFNYFNMSVGALCGMAAGIYFHRWSMNGGMLRGLSGKTALLGTLAATAGLAMLYGTTRSLEGLKNESILPVWKWTFYSGALLLVAAGLCRILTAYERLAKLLRITVNLFGVLGQISLPVFVFHQLVLRIKALLVYAGLPDAVALAIPLVAFLAVCAWMMRRLYELYYGSVSEKPATSVPAQEPGMRFPS